MQTRAWMLFVFASVSLLFAKGLLKNKKDLFKIENAVYFVSNPAMLRNAASENVTDSMYAILSTKTDSFLTLAGVKTWKRLPDDKLRQLTIGFDQLANRQTGRIDSLPYTAMEIASETGAKYLVAFYVYRMDPNKGIVPQEKKKIQTGTIGGGITTPAIPVYKEITLALSNIQIACALFDIKTDKCEFFISTDDEDYVSYVEFVEELFSKFGFIKGPEVLWALTLPNKNEVDNLLIVQAVSDIKDKQNIKRKQQQIRASKTGKLEFGSPVSSEGLSKKGARSPKAFKDVFEFNYAVLIDPYCRRLTQVPSCAGRVTVRFGVDGDGNVVSPAVTTSTISDATLEAEFLQALSQITFDPTMGSSEIVTVEIPFTFSQK
jgi:TonB family protein